MGIERVFYSCPVCGRYECSALWSEFKNPQRFNLNHLSSYLLYKGFKDTGKDYRYYTTMSKEQCDLYQQRFKIGDTEHGYPIHLLSETVENWYPKTFAEKIDYILLYLYSHTAHIGQQIILEKEALFSCFFIDRYEYVLEKSIKRDSNSMNKEVDFIINYLVQRSFIIVDKDMESKTIITLAPDGYTRVDTFQKSEENSKTAFVAMQFGEETKTLREAIRSGISDAGYEAIFLDEIEHNDLITPELLKHIKNCKFMVVDLTHQNNGAYFEEGYAMGLSKPVIQLCRADIPLHFDVAQKNTIMWDVETDIIERLKNRIIATID